MKRSQLFSMIAVLALLAATPLLAAEFDLSGTWKLNEEKSDRMERPEPGRGTGGGMRGGRSGGRGGSGGPPSGARGMRGGGPEGGRAMRSDILILSQTEGALIFKQEDGRERTIFTSGEPQTTVGFHGEDVEVTATWKESQLVIERSGGDDRHGMTETYAISGDGRTLTVTRSMSRRNGERDFKQVYDRAE